MTLRDRLYSAWNALTGRDMKAIATIVEPWRDRKPTYAEVKFETMVREGYRKNELIFACIAKTANSASQVQMQVVDADGEPIEDHPLKSIIQRPNPFMSEFDLWSSVIIYQKLAGRAIFEKVRDRGGELRQLWPLRPDYITVHPDSRTGIGFYEYKLPGQGRGVMLPPEDVLDIKLFDPLNMFHAWPPTAVAARIGDIDNAMTDHMKLFFEMGGYPPVLLTSDQALRSNDIDQIRADWRRKYGGHEHWLEPAVLGMGAKAQLLGFGFKDMGADILDARDEARICQVMQVPPIIVGAKVGLDRSTFANYKEARSAWWEDDLTPQYANMTDALQNQVVDVEYADENVFIEFDFSSVRAFQEDTDAVWLRAKEAWLANGIKKNEYRRLIGQDELGPEGEVYYRDEFGGAIALTDQGGQEDEPDVEEDEDETEEFSANGHGEYKAATNAPDDDDRRAQEKRMKSAMRGYFSEQRQRILAEMDLD